MAETAPSRAKTQQRAVLGAFVGTAIEWYDFYIFGTAAALVFGRVFYPDVSPGAALIASFATFWVGFLARPIGGIIFSHFGDRYGRKNTLVVTLLLMGVGTTAIGLLPGYAQIGMAAPILLVVLRAVQGLAVGGEWGGAVVLATENATEGKRGMAGTWVQQGSPAGSILATVMFLIVGTLPDEAFLSWGWRIPFLLSAALVIVALVIRLKVEESEDFTNIQATEKVAKIPLVELFRSSGWLVLFGILASIIGIAMAYFTNTFLLAWTTGELALDRTAILNVLLMTAIFQFLWQPVAALIAQRFGEQRVMLGGLLWLVAASPFLFWAIQSGSIPWIGVTLILTTMGGSTYYALLASTLSGAFPARVRYTGVSVAYQVCATIFGGSTPLLAQWVLTSSGGSAWAVMALFLALIAATIFGVLALASAQRRAPADASHSAPAEEVSA
ncbi:MFS transporter [Leucobacter sp. M11]|uniref:MFS transporter n=1 Tax=Leucobacter sp. M11 TaxID=2993565 RepID=UPI002D7FCCAB|nr:MFS transporter [Leucobacter sp. M11]MEB4615689.1 MFS transporter [Leucobacter sp. M11]